MEQQTFIALTPTPRKPRRQAGVPQWSRAEPRESFTPTVLVRLSHYHTWTRGKDNVPTQD
jgi:hypothetical protein